MNNKLIYYLLLTLMRNSDIVLDFKIKLVKEFFKMRETLNSQSNINKVYVTLSDSKVREAFFIAFDGICYYSKENLTKTHFRIDHILPKSKGGEDIVSNLVLCKPNINQIKSDSYNESFVNYHQNIINRNFAPRVEAILNLLEDNKISEYSKIRFFQLFRDLKNLPKNSNLRVGYFDGKRQRYFKNLEVVL